MAGRKPKSDFEILRYILNCDRGFAGATEISQEAEDVDMSRQGVDRALKRMMKEYEFLQTSKLGDNERSPRVWHITNEISEDELKEIVNSNIN